MHQTIQQLGVFIKTVQNLYEIAGIPFEAQIRAVSGSYYRPVI